MRQKESDTSWKGTNNPRGALTHVCPRITVPCEGTGDTAQLVTTARLANIQLGYEILDWLMLYGQGELAFTTTGGDWRTRTRCFPDCCAESPGRERAPTRRLSADRTKGVRDGGGHVGLRCHGMAVGGRLLMAGVRSTVSPCRDEGGAVGAHGDGHRVPRRAPLRRYQRCKPSERPTVAPATSGDSSGAR